jgi:hypothetical protein
MAWLVAGLGVPSRGRGERMDETRVWRDDGLALVLSKTSATLFNWPLTTRLLVERSLESRRRTLKGFRDACVRWFYSAVPAIAMCT